MKKKKIEHTTFRNGDLFCLNCGGNHKLNFPIESQMMSKMIEAFNSLHEQCPKTWTEPKPDAGQTMTGRAYQWLQEGETGMSSKTMWAFFMGKPSDSYRINHPSDPDDFSRCYKLLEFVPEWKVLIPKLEILSPPWKALSQNWSKLTEMYEQNVRENWKNSDKIGMHRFMFDLLQKS